MQEKRGRRVNAYGQTPKTSREARRRLILRLIAVLAVAVVAVLTVVRLSRGYGLERQISATALNCGVSQNVTIFGEYVLYYDGLSIHCMNPTGGIRWSFPVGSGARFAVSNTNMVVWNGTEVYIVDANGRATYNENMDGTVQFARIGSRYCAIVFGDDTEPTLMVKNLDGTQVDAEREAYSGMMIEDVGFYGEADQYMWTLALDVYGVAINTVMNTFQVGKMNTGVVDLGSYLAYRVIYDNGSLRVFTTQQMYSYDYKAVQDLSATQLVHGWQVISVDTPARGASDILLARTVQLNGTEGLSDLRVMSGSSDRRFTPPEKCVGALVQSGSVYAISGSQLYRTSTARQQFYSYQLPLPQGVKVTSLIGVTSSGRAIVGCGSDVYAISLPR